MPYYENDQTGSPTVLVEQGWPVYLLGSRDSSLNESYLTSVSIDTNVATVGIEAFSGDLPKAGQIVSIKGALNAQFNVTNAVITAVNLDAAGNGTISFALTGDDVAETPDSGSVKIVSAIEGEDIAEGASMAGTIHHCHKQYACNIFCDVQFVTIPTACTVTLQTAMRNIDSDFKDAATVATVAGGEVTQSQTNFVTTAPFFRFSISELDGEGKIAALAVI